MLNRLFLENKVRNIRKTHLLCAKNVGHSVYQQSRQVSKLSGLNSYSLRTKDKALRYACGSQRSSESGSRNVRQDSSILFILSWLVQIVERSFFNHVSASTCLDTLLFSLQRLTDDQARFC